MAASDTTSRRETFPSAWAVLVGYVMLIVARLADSFVTNPHHATWLAVVFELAIFVIPGWVCICLSPKRPTLSELLIRRPCARNIIPCASALVALICLAFLLTVLLCGDSTAAGSFDLYNTFTVQINGGFWDNIRLILCYALLPAVCEEVIFRGLVCRDYRTGGAVRSVIMSSLLFGMLHLDLRLLPVYIVSGVVLCLLLYATRSLAACIAVHLLYNIFGIYLQPYLTSFYVTTGSRALFVMLTAALMLAAAAVFCHAASKLYCSYATEERAAAEAGGKAIAPDTDTHPLSSGTSESGLTGSPVTGYVSPGYPVGLTPEKQMSLLYSSVVSIPFLLCVAVFIIGIILF